MKIKKEFTEEIRKIIKEDKAHIVKRPKWPDKGAFYPKPKTDKAET